MSSRLHNLFFYLSGHRLVRFLFSGGMAFATNFILLFVLVDFFGVWYLLAAVISFICSVLVSFLLQKFFTFADFTRDRIPQQGSLYLGLQVFNLCLNTFLMYVGVDLLHISYLISQVIIATGMAVYNFFIYKHFVFRPDTSYTGTK